MSSTNVFVVKDARDANTSATDVVPSQLFVTNADAWAYARALSGYFGAAAEGAKTINIVCQSNGVAASGTITFASFANNDTITVNGVTLTGKTTPTLATEFAVGASNAACAINAAACINAQSANLAKQVIATASGAVVTVTANVPGTWGNYGTLAISAHGSVSGANLSGGTLGAVSSAISLGI
jgi:phage tail sheath gpL-like